MKVDPEEVIDADACEISSPDTSSSLANAMCQRETCGHYLTVHSSGLAIHGKCRLAGCRCPQAQLTDQARDRVKKGIMP